MGTFTVPGALTPGRTLTANINLNGFRTIYYEWNRVGSGGSGTAISDANSNIYALQAADVGSAITVTVTRELHSGSLTSAPTVTVTPQRYDIYVSAGSGGGQITTDPSRNAGVGTNVTVYVTPDTGLGFYLASLTIMNITASEQIIPEDNGNGVYTFTMPASIVTIAGVFVAPPGSQGNPIQLTLGEWKPGEFTSTTEELWYQFNATASTYYYVWLYDHVDSSSVNSRITIYRTNGTQYRDTDIDNSSEYYLDYDGGIAKVKVTPVTSGATGTFEIAYNTTSGTIPTRPFGPPVNVKAVYSAAGSVYITWTRVQEATSGYYIYRSLSPNDGYSSIATVANPSTTSYNNITNVVPGTTYYYKVASRASATEESAMSATAIATPPAVTPLTANTPSPGIVQGGPQNDTQVWYSFEAVSGQIYYVWMDDGNGSCLVYCDYLSNAGTAYISYNFFGNGQFTAARDGTVYIRVTGAGYGIDYAYTLMYNTSPPPSPSAALQGSDVTISATKANEFTDNGAVAANCTFTIDLSYAILRNGNPSMNLDASTWFSPRVAGLSYRVTSASTDNRSFVVTVTGTPTAVPSAPAPAPVTITIPWAQLYNHWGATISNPQGEGPVVTGSVEYDIGEGDF
jgi:hypothetical protein